MCGRYSQLTDPEVTANKYGAKLEVGHLVHTDLGWDKVETSKMIDDIKAGGPAPLVVPNYNVSHSNPSIIIHEEFAGVGKLMVRAEFRYQKKFKDWKSGKQKVFAPLNARCEGKDKGKSLNPDDLPDYPGPYKIFDTSFWKEINEKRCAVPVNYFIEGPKNERLKLPYVIRRGDSETFLLAGTWKFYVNEETGEQLKDFAIITTAANWLCREIGHHRCPVLIPDHFLDRWIHPSTPREELIKVFKPFDDSQFFAYRISPKVSKPNHYGFGNNSEHYIKAVEPAIFPPHYTGPKPVVGDAQIFGPNQGGG